MKLQPLTIDVGKCLRCGGDHHKMVFKPFKRESPTPYKHWALCPKTKEPLIIGALNGGDPVDVALREGGHTAVLSTSLEAALNLARKVFHKEPEIPARKHKRRCPKCRRGPVIVSTYKDESVSCHCADCGNTWQPRSKACK